MRKLESQGLDILCWADDVESGALQQAQNIAVHPHAFHHVALMPDVHQGYGFPIGTVVAFKNVICPYGVGADVACGMLAARIGGGINDRVFKDPIVAGIFHQRLALTVPLGFHHNDSIGLPGFEQETDELLQKHGFPEDGGEYGIVTKEAVANQLGTLGGNNHFMEVQYDEEGRVWFMIHCGSRNLGARICTEFYRLARTFTDQSGCVLPDRNLSFFPADSKEGLDYIQHMALCVDFSYMNRTKILERMMTVLGELLGPGLTVEEVHQIHHNFASLETHFGEDVWVHRKGATPAIKGTIGIIPGSMGSYSYLVQGAGEVDGDGNPESFRSCSHGAGRKMSRKDAREKIDIDRVREQMKGITFNDHKGILEESPGAYKDISVVMSQQAEGEHKLVEVVHELHPQLNLKDSGTQRDLIDKEKRENGISRTKSEYSRQDRNKRKAKNRKKRR